MSMTVNLATLDDTARLGRALAEALRAGGVSQAVLLEGGLGAGKTTLVRFLVEALPGGELAEVSSPSFTLCNIYPTRPEVWHYDLYRLEAGPPPDELLETLDHLAAPVSAPEESPVLLLVEWPERLEAAFLPAGRIHCRLTAGQNDRRASFKGRGEAAEETLERLRALLSRPAG